MNPDAQHLWRAPRWALAILLAVLGMLGPFSIDTYIPAFTGIAHSLDATPVQMQQTLSAYLFGFAFMSLFHGAISDPDNLNRIPAKEDEAILTYALNKFFPEGYESTLVMKTCMYTNTPDENFILDFLPGYDKDVCVAAGFSGHGFKFASVVGEIMTDLAVKGGTAHPIGFLNAKRF